MGTPTREERSFSCLDTRERTKEKVKAGEKMAENFSAELKRIKYVSSLRHTGDEYSFLNAPLRNFLNAIFSQADPNYAPHQVPRRDSQLVGLGGLRRSFASFWHKIIRQIRI